MKPARLFVRLADLCEGQVKATTYPFPDAQEYVIEPERLDSQAPADKPSEPVKPWEQHPFRTLHTCVEQLANRFKGYLPWRPEDKTATVRGHEMFIKDTLERADACLLIIEHAEKIGRPTARSAVVASVTDHEKVAKELDGIEGVGYGLTHSQLVAVRCARDILRATRSATELTADADRYRLIRSKLCNGESLEFDRFPNVLNLGGLARIKPSEIDAAVDGMRENATDAAPDSRSHK